MPVKDTQKVIEEITDKLSAAIRFFFLSTCMLPDHGSLTGCARSSHASRVLSSVFICIMLFAVAMLVFRSVEKISCVVIMDSAGLCIFTPFSMCCCVSSSWLHPLHMTSGVCFYS